MKQTILYAILFCTGFATSAQEVKLANSFSENFSDSTLKNFRWGSTGTKADFKWKSGVNSSTEPGTKVLLLKMDPEDRAGAGRGPEIISNEFTHFGTYSARLKVPNVKDTQPNVGAVVGYFTYHMDSIDGLSEIDFEWLIADPTIIYIGTWTGPRGQLKRIGRTINLAKGIIYNTNYREGHQGQRTPLTGAQNQPETIAALEGYDASLKFYTYGFDWYSNRIRWWIIHPVTKEKIVLWDYQGSQTGIPQNQTHYRMNFWHTNEWSVETNPRSIEKPLRQYELEVDWMGYERFPGTNIKAQRFTWPLEKQAAISLTFDDARESQVIVGTNLLDSYSVKATFFVVPAAVEKRLEGWKKAVASGHEIGNHSLVHPCSGNFSWSRDKALEDYTLKKMRAELVKSNDRIEELLGVKAEVFAYPCGQKYVGRGTNTKSYVPLVAKMFIAGRGWMDEAPNDPLHCNFQQLTGVEMDGKNFDQVLALIEDAKKNGLWLILAGHEMGAAGAQTTRLDMLKQLAEYVQNPANGIWIAPMGTVAKYVQERKR